jgi:hypothetical protein
MRKDFVNRQKVKKAEKNGREPLPQNETGEAIGLPGSEKSRPKA